MDALSYADQMEAMALFYAKKARDARREAKRAAAAEEASLGAAAAVEEFFVPEEVVFVPEEVVEEAAAAPAANYDALLAALGMAPPPLLPAEEVVEEAAAAKRQIIIRPYTVLSLPEDVEELVDRVRAGEMAAPLGGMGTARYTKDWQAGRRGDPGNALCSQIREQIRAGVNTKKTITEALAQPYKLIDAAVREMSKMGVILC